MDKNMKQPSKQSEEEKQTGFFIKMNDLDSMQVKNVVETVLENHIGNGHALTGFYPVRRNVKVMHDKVEMHMSEFKSEYRRKDSDIFIGLRNQIRKHYNFYCLDSVMSFKEREEQYFEANNGEVKFTNEEVKDYVVTKEAYDTFFKKRKLDKQAMEFDKLQEVLESNSYLPINKLTKHYIKFEEGISLLSVRLESSNFQTQTISTKMITSLQSFSNKSWSDFEIVNLEKTANSFYINMICPQEEEDDVLNTLQFALEKSGVYKTNDSLFYNFDIEIERNLHKENYSKDWYHYFTGGKAKRLKDVFVKQENQFLDHDLYM
ncbi:hypothetical protein P9X10_02665 [Bacillus cereus]|nr:hypothetical protein [Bacillus cereus]